MAFGFGRIARDSAVTWNDDWKDQATLPRLVRLILRDRVTGADLLAGAEFLIRADASGGCSQRDASACFSGSPASKPRRTHDE